MASPVHSWIVGHFDQRWNVPGENFQVSVQAQSDDFERNSRVLHWLAIYCVLQSAIFDNFSRIYFTIPGKFLKTQMVLKWS